jgi:CYTH domain-containing protein
VVGTVPLEIERRYRLARPPSAADLAAHGARSFRLEQVYLLAPPDPGAGELPGLPAPPVPPGGLRVRRTEDPDGHVSYRLTRKRHLRSLVREEVEVAIDALAYARWLREADPARRPIRKTRHVVQHGSQQLEIDVFLDPPDLVLVEVELRSEDEPVRLPDWLGEHRDVSADPRYANASLALRDWAFTPF